MANQDETCPACGGLQSHWAWKGGYRLARCHGCRTVVARGEVEVAPAGADYTAYHQQAEFRVAEAARASLQALVASAQRYRRHGRWLDIGFGEGALLRTVEGQGWDCAGIEVSPHALHFGRTCGWRVAHPGEATQVFSNDAFDVVTLVEVIEHIVDPLPSLEQAIRWLRPGGLLYLTTPNADSLNRKVLGPRWSVFCPPEHLTIWSPRGLRIALTRLGIGPVRLRTHGLNPIEILAALRQADGASVHRQQAGESLNETLGRTAPRRLAKRAANGVLSLLGVGDTIKAWSERPI